MADTVQVVFEAKDAASGVIQGLVAKMGTLGGVVDSAGQLFSGAEGAVASFGVTLATQVVEGVIAAKDAALELNDTVEEMQFLAGGTAEEASRLTNVFERFDISAQEATAATRQLTKDGLSPSIDTLARLSDQYNALSGPVEKNAFLMDHFGRAGFRMAEMMSRGGDALRGYADSLPSALIMTEENIQAAENYRMAMFDLKNSFDVLKVTVGNEVIPMFTDMAEMATTDITALETIQEAVKEAAGEFFKARSPIENFKNALIDLESWAAKAVNAGGAFGFGAVDLKATVTVDDKQAMGAIGKINDALDNLTGGDYTIRFNAILQVQEKRDQLKELEQQAEEVRKKIADISMQRTPLSKEQQQDLEDLKKQYEDLTGQVDDSKKAMELWAKQFMLSMKETQLAQGGLTNEEFNQLLQFGQDLGVIDPETVKQTEDMLKAVNNTDPNAASAAAEAAAGLGGLSNVSPQTAASIKSIMSSINTVNRTAASDLKSIGDSFGSINKDSMDSASKMIDRLTNVDPSNANAAWQAIKNIVNMDGRTITVYVNQVTTSSDSSGGTPTSGSSPTPTSGTTNNFYGPVTLPSFGTTSEMLAGLMG